MTPLQLEPSAPAPWTSTMFGRVFISVVPSWSGLTAILRSEALDAVCVTPLHLRMPVWRDRHRRHRRCVTRLARIPLESGLAGTRETVAGVPREGGPRCQAATYSRHLGRCRLERFSSCRWMTYGRQGLRRHAPAGR